MYGLGGGNFFWVYLNDRGIFIDVIFRGICDSVILKFISKFEVFW